MTQLKICFSESCLVDFKKTINLSTGLKPENKDQESLEVETPLWLSKA